MRARAIFAKDALRIDGAPRAEHLLVVDERGRLFERFSDEPAGHWNEVPLPNEPAKRQQRTTRKRSKA